MGDLGSLLTASYMRYAVTKLQIAAIATTVCCPTRTNSMTTVPNAAMLGANVSGDPDYAHTLWQRHGKQVQAGRTIPIENRLMLSVAEVRIKQR